MDNTQTGASVLAQAMVSAGIEHVFLYPGGTIAPLLSELVACGVTFTCARTEQGAGFAALAAAKISGKPQVCLVTSGPGATNAVTCVADAYYDSVPLILIAGQVATSDINREHKVRQTGFQETDTVAMFKPVSKVLKRMGNGDNLAATIKALFATAEEGRSGPAVVELPMDIQRLPYDTKAEKQAVRFDFLENQTSQDRHPPVAEQAPSETDIGNALQAIANAKRPLILAGNGIYLAGAVDEFRRSVKHSGIPVVTSLPAQGVLSRQDPLYFDFVGYSGEFHANLALHFADVLICLGARLDLRQTGSEIQTFTENKTIVRIDVDGRELEDGRVKAEHCVRMDLQSFLSQYGRAIRIATSPQAWIEQLQCWRSEFASHQFYEQLKLSSYHVITMVSKLTAGTPCVVSSGVGTHQQLVARYFDFDFPTRRWLTSAGHGTMGYDLPAIIGAMIGNRDHQVGLCFVGDGSFQMNIQELALIRELNLPIKIFLLDNRRLGIVSQFQLQNWDTDLATGNKTNPDFVAIAKAYGIPAYSCDTRESLTEKAAATLQTQGPALLHCNIDYCEDLQPMLLGGQALNEMYPFNKVRLKEIEIPH